MVNLDYFYGSEGEQYRFYQIPAILLEDEEYKKISDTAKLLYGILLSRLALSKKNNWIEKETNRVYILYNRNDKFPYGKPQTDEVARGSGTESMAVRD